ncbi:MAG: hypothetical protein CFE25_15470 [Chitinophagaceae bacterium BSSC1]|nr:MAG: hypothetical protein CFE25_15470 [Chitinophagaceae bacterium BSSC1]
MKKLATLILITISFALISNAQIKPECLSGNCVNGKGIYKYSNGAVYDGDFVDSLMSGIGVMVWPSGDKYIGEWKRGNRTGKGKFIFKDGRVYEGDFNAGKLNGKGTMIYKDGSKYIGDWKDGNITGKGKISYASGGSYEGDFLNNTLEGKGTKIYKDNSVYTGEWKADNRHGQGKYTYANGTIEEGEFFNNIYQNPMNESYSCVKGDCNNGIGTYNFAYGPRTSYTGQFKDGKPDGEGTLIEYDDIYKGHFEKGKKNGNGILTVKDGSTYTGIWKKDELIEGTFKDKKGTSYTGQFTKGDLGMIVYQGEGVETSGRFMGRTKKGKWEKGDLTGKGVIVYPNGYYMEAIFKETANSNKKYFNNQNIQITEAEFDKKVIYQFCAEGDCFNGIGIGEANHGINFFVGYWVNGKKEGFVADFKNETDYYYGIWNADTLVKKINDKEAEKYMTSNYKVFLKLLNTDRRYVAARSVMENCNTRTCISGDCINGIGTEYFCNGSIYTGNFINGTYSGKGEFKWANGDIYNGNWVNNKRQGKGEMTWQKKEYYIGDWVNDVRQGKGRARDTKARIKEGDWINDKFVITERQRQINEDAKNKIRALEQTIAETRTRLGSMVGPSNPSEKANYDKIRENLEQGINAALKLMDDLDDTVS